MTTEITKIVLAIVLFSVLSGCSSSDVHVVQREISQDGRYFAEVTLNRGSALKYDWYFTGIGLTNQTQFDKLRGNDETQLCSLQGRGQLSVYWSSPRELMVTCTGCDEKQFYTTQTSWNGVAIRFATQN
jgi:hypothetical protein